MGLLASKGTLLSCVVAVVSDYHDKQVLRSITCRVDDDDDGVNDDFDDDSDDGGGSSRALLIIKV